MEDVFVLYEHGLQCLGIRHVKYRFLSRKTIHVGVRFVVYARPRQTDTEESCEPDHWTVVQGDFSMRFFAFRSIVLMYVA